MHHYVQDPGSRNAPSERGGILLVSLYSWTCITIGVAIARFVIALIHKVKIDYDDGTVLVASILYTGATVGCQYAVNEGLGQHFSDIKPEHAVEYFKAAYATQLLQIAAMAFAKLSTAFLIERVARQSRRERGILFGSVALWATYSIFALGLECGPLRPWEFDRKKFGHEGALISTIVLNMVSDIVLTAWIFPILHPLDMDKVQQRTVKILFASRAVVPLVGIVQVWAAAKLGGSEDPTWDGFELALVNHVVTSLSLIVASVPRIKRFIGSCGVNDPRIHNIELPQSTEVKIQGDALKLVPSSSANFTTTVMSGNGRKTEKSKASNDWQKLVSMGSRQDENTSRSSLFENHGGVMLQQEITVQVEDDNHPKTDPS